MSLLNLKTQLALLLILLPYFLSAQAFNDIEWYDVDSLQQILPSQQGEARLHTLNDLAASLSFEDEEQCSQYANEALQLADELGDEVGLANANRNLGLMEFYNGRYPQALDYFQKALNIFEKANSYYLMAQTLEDIAKVHFFVNNLEKAFDVMFMARDIYRGKYTAGKRVGNVRDTMTFYSAIGLAYRVAGRPDTAIKIYLTYLRIGVENDFDQMDLLMHLGLLSRSYSEAGQLDSALYYLKRGMNYPDLNLSIQAIKNHHLQYMAEIFELEGAADSSRALYQQSYQWAMDHGFLKQALKSSIHLADIYSKEEDKNQQKKHLLLSEQLLLEMMDKQSYYRYDSLKYVVSDGTELYFPFTMEMIRETLYSYADYIYYQLFHLFHEEDDLQKAMDYLIRCSAARDTLRKLASNREAIEIQTRYETERKDAEIVNLSQQNQLKEYRLSQTRWLAAGLGLLMLLIMLLAILIIRQNRLRNSQQTLLLQQRLLRVQMNPHFLFNILSSIQNFIVKENKTAASDYLSRFSGLMRQVLYSSTTELIPLEDEIGNIEGYLSLQKIRYRDMFDYKVDVNEDIDVESVMIPPMLVQPFIENAIEHGIQNLGRRGHITVRVYEKGDRIILEIEDDGIGRKRAQEIIKQSSKGHQSMATQLTEERINTINHRRKRKISMQVEDLTDDQGEAKGTRVIFEFPVVKE